MRQNWPIMTCRGGHLSQGYFSSKTRGNFAAAAVRKRKFSFHKSIDQVSITKLPNVTLVKHFFSASIWSLRSEISLKNHSFVSLSAVKKHEFLGNH